MSTSSRPKTAILAIDQGTHASRALLFSGEGRVLFVHHCKIGMTRRGPHRVEQDPEEIISSLQEVIQKARGYASTHKLDIRRAGISTQRSTVLAWDKKSGEVLYPALSWQDTRAHHYLDDIRDKAGEIKILTGLQISAHYGASKLRWLLENVPDISAAAASDRLCLGPLSSFILYKLIEKHPLVVDHGNASRTLLWNIRSCQWEPRLLEFFRISPEWLPKVCPIRSDYGCIEGTNIQVCAVNGDQPSALFGQGPVPPQGATINLGSGAFILFDTETRVITHPRLLSTVSDSDHRSCRYCLEGTVNGAGTSLQWAEKTWGISLRNTLQDQQARETPLFINTVGGLGSPWWHTNLTARLIGLTPEDCRRNPTPCLFAILESIVFMLFANIEQMASVGISIHKLSIAGGLSRYRFLIQALSDLSGLRVTRFRETEMTARGIAFLASGRSQPFPSLDGEPFTPQANRSLEIRYRRYVKLVSEGVDAASI